MTRGHIAPRYSFFMARMVLLQHNRPDGSRYFDWMIEPIGGGPGSLESRLVELVSNPEDTCLFTFRVLERIDKPDVKAFTATLFPLHPRTNLTLYNPIRRSARGTARRVAGGLVRKVHLMGHETDGIIHALAIRGKFNGGLEYTWAGIRVSTTVNPPVEIAPAHAWSGLWEFKRSAPCVVQKAPERRREDDPYRPDDPAQHGWH